MRVSRERGEREIKEGGVKEVSTAAPVNPPLTLIIVNKIKQSAALV